LDANLREGKSAVIRHTYLFPVARFPLRFDLHVAASSKKHQCKRYRERAALQGRVRHLESLAALAAEGGTRAAQAQAQLTKRCHPERSGASEAQPRAVEGPLHPLRMKAASGNSLNDPRPAITNVRIPR